MAIFFLDRRWPHSIKKFHVEVCPEIIFLFICLYIPFSQSQILISNPNKSPELQNHIFNCLLNISSF